MNSANPTEINCDYESCEWMGIVSISPPSRRGGRADVSDDSLPMHIGAAGEVKPPLRKWSDVPRRADSEVALHLLDRRGVPSSKEGISELFEPAATVQTSSLQESLT